VWARQTASQLIFPGWCRSCRRFRSLVTWMACASHACPGRHVRTFQGVCRSAAADDVGVILLSARILFFWGGKLFFKLALRCLPFQNSKNIYHLNLTQGWTRHWKATRSPWAFCIVLLGHLLPLALHSSVALTVERRRTRGEFGLRCPPRSLMCSGRNAKSTKITAS